MVNLYIWLTISSCHQLIAFALRLIKRDGGLSTLCHSCGFVCQHRVLKMFPGPGCFRSNDWVVWPWHLLVNLYICLSNSSCYSSIPMALWLIGMDSGLSTLRHSCGFACQHRVLKTFPVSGYLHSHDGVVWLWHLLVNLYTGISINILHSGNKSPMQRGFFKIAWVIYCPPVRFLDELYNLHYFVIMFSLIKS